MEKVNSILTGAMLTTLLLLVMTSCGGGASSHVGDTQGDTIVMRYARNLTMVDYGDYATAEFRNPWDTTAVLQTYVLVPSGSDVPATLPAGTVVRVPLSRAVVYTSVHSSLMDELGAIDAISGVCDAEYIHCPNVRQRLADGDIVDCGSSMTPNIEKILMLNPDAIVLSAFENSNDHNKVDQIGIPIIDCTDYMETSPLGRAEWMRFYGRLIGKADLADSIFAETEKAYNDIKARMATVTERPKVLTEMIYGQSWDVPAAYSTIGVMIEDAGGLSPFHSYKQSGSVKLTPEEVLYTAHDADVWLIKYSQSNDMTLTQLANDNPIYSKFNPYKTGRVYGCNVMFSSYFEEANFHPHWILAEMAQVFHPEAGVEPERKYYKQLDK